MCKWGTSVPVRVGLKTVSVDACLAPLVVALNAGGLPTVASCCGHGKIPATIGLADGRWIVVTDRAGMQAIVDSYGVNIHGESTPSSVVDGANRGDSQATETPSAGGGNFPIDIPSSVEQIVSVPPSPDGALNVGPAYSADGGLSRGDARDEDETNVRKVRLRLVEHLAEDSTDEEQLAAYIDGCKGLSDSQRWTIKGAVGIIVAALRARLAQQPSLNDFQGQERQHIQSAIDYLGARGFTVAQQQPEGERIAALVDAVKAECDFIRRSSIDNLRALDIRLRLEAAVARVLAPDPREAE